MKNRFLWAHTHAFTKAGKERRVEHWDNLYNVKKGAVIFCNFNRNVISIAVAKRGAYKASSPPTKEFDECKMWIWSLADMIKIYDF